MEPTDTATPGDTGTAGTPSPTATVTSTATVTAAASPAPTVTTTTTAPAPMDAGVRSLDVEQFTSVVMALGLVVLLLAFGLARGSR